MAAAALLLLCTTLLTSAQLVTCAPNSSIAIRQSNGIEIEFLGAGGASSPTQTVTSDVEFSVDLPFDIGEICVVAPLGTQCYFFTASGEETMPLIIDHSPGSCNILGPPSTLTSGVCSGN